MNYLKINTKSTIAKEALEYALASQDWFQYFNFDLVLLPTEILQKDPFLQNVSSKFRLRAGVLRLPTNTCYDWHTDDERGVAINMLLTPEVRSNCLFTKGGDTSFKFEELVYEPDTFYIFNTQVEHTVLNYEKPRYLLSVEFELTKEHLSFNDLISQIKSPS
jgi:hypothetical protein